LPHAKKWQQYSPHRAVVQSATERIRRGELGRTLEWVRMRLILSRYPNSLSRAQR